ncbi:hypothetical protein FHX59_001188 [Paraburkholderia silvatlantica]|uniref:Uncharacterized protein n=1 Tax=Paraburkholderia silvatlantica TaxID=321895 RepID=A0ABR6FH77_9BURK|nr:hypothetical protein [Paraburkholderia silvatlantica]MBB2926779.1 hypothetical protein [Paraburkholderia silvatlantica]
MVISPAAAPLVARQFGRRHGVAFLQGFTGKPALAGLIARDTRRFSFCVIFGGNLFFGAAPVFVRPTFRRAVVFPELISASPDALFPLCIHGRSSDVRA